MARARFDPSKVAGPPPLFPSAEPPPATDRPLTVSQLGSLIDSALKAHVPARVRVIGEISGFSDRTHWYFRLKDDQAEPGHEPVIDCVMFASAAKKLRFTPRDGQKVVLSGRVEFYARQGRTQFYADHMEPVGAGELELKFRALCEELRREGFFDPARKRAIPEYPRRVAVVTSRTGAALQDVLNTMAQRCPAVEVAVVDVRVQGAAAAPEIAAALDWLAREHERFGIDAVLLTRGGGSMEDLWAFNERIVAEAIARSPVPVVAAIGHETDTTIAELVADERCSTPTQAAMRLTPDRAALEEQAGQLSARLATALVRRLERQKERLRDLSRRPALLNPRAIVVHAAERSAVARDRLRSALLRRLHLGQALVERLASRLALVRPEAQHAARAARTRELGIRLARAWEIAGERRRHHLAALERELIVSGPRSVLARGYSVTTLADGTLVRSAGQTRPGSALLTRVADGSISSTVTGGTPAREEAAGSAPQLPPRRRPSRSAPARDQMDLFGAQG